MGVGRGGGCLGHKQTLWKSVLGQARCRRRLLLMLTEAMSVGLWICVSRVRLPAFALVAGKALLLKPLLFSCILLPLSYS